VHLALEVADRVYVLNRGQVVVSGPAAQVRDDAQVLESSYLGSTVL
jgi:ABC-type branched-subunit amino acid transport system ATPase component